MLKKLFFIILTLAVSVSPALSADIYAADNTNSFSNDMYSIVVPDSFSIDSETVADYTSLYNDNVTIGISTHPNTDSEDASRYTEKQIADIANDTLDTLKAQSKADIKITMHEIVAFAAGSYPSVHIVYEGTNEKGEPVYMEEYIVTTVNYKYTFVLYAGTAEDTENDDVSAVINSFTVLDDLITHTEPADTGSVLTILIISGAAVLIALIATLIIITRHKKR